MYAALAEKRGRFCVIFVVVYIMCARAHGHGMHGGRAAHVRMDVSDSCLVISGMGGVGAGDVAAGIHMSPLARGVQLDRRARFVNAVVFYLSVPSCAGAARDRGEMGEGFSTKALSRLLWRLAP